MQVHVPWAHHDRRVPEVTVLLLMLLLMCFLLVMKRTRPVGERLWRTLLLAVVVIHCAGLIL